MIKKVKLKWVKCIQTNSAKDYCVRSEMSTNQYSLDLERSDFESAVGANQMGLKTKLTS
jgi:hypothetical protein